MVLILACDGTEEKSCGSVNGNVWATREAEASSGMDLSVVLWKDVVWKRGGASGVRRKHHWHYCMAYVKTLWAADQEWYMVS